MYEESSIDQLLTFLFSVLPLGVFEGVYAHTLLYIQHFVDRKLSLLLDI